MMKDGSGIMALMRADSVTVSPEGARSTAAGGSEATRRGMPLVLA
jgi:hypothetical protein